MFAILYAAIIGLLMARHPSPVGLISGAWGIVVLALAALAVPNIDVAALAANTGLALLGYNLALVAALAASGLTRRRQLSA